MKFFILFCGLLGFASAIYQGVETNISEAPYVVSHQTLANDHYCSGTIIGSTWVLTSAHCAERIGSKSQLRYNSTFYENGTLATIKSRIIHEKWISGKRDGEYNIALLETTTKMAVSSAAIAKVPCKSDLKKGDLLFFAGWGDNGVTGRQQKLHKMMVPYAAHDCRDVYAANGLSVTSNTFCAGYIDHLGPSICNFDEGGAVVKKPGNMVHGIADLYLGCGVPKFISVFTFTAHYAEWIKAKSGISCWHE